MSRNQKIKELENKLEHSISPQRKADILNKLCWDLRTTDIHKAADYAQQALDISEKEGYQRGIAHAKTNIAFAKYINGANVEVAFKLANEAVKIFESIGDVQGIYSTTGILGIINWGIGNSEKAFIMMQQSLKLEHTEENLMWRAWGNYTLGTFYLEFNDYENALNHHQFSIPYFEEAGEIVGLAAATIGIGDIYQSKGEHQKALDQYFEGLNLSKEESLKGTEARALNQIGLVYENLGQHEKAINYIEQSLSIREELNNFQGIISSFQALGLIHTKTKELEKALGYLHKAEEKAQTGQASRKLIKIYQSLAQVYKEKGDAWKALEFYEKYIHLKSELAGEESGIQLRNLKSVFEIEKAQNEAEIHKLKNIELKKAYEQIEAQNKSIIDSIEYAKRIQEAILPPTEEIEKYSEHSFIYYAPKDIVSGDFYWIEMIGNHEDEDIADLEKEKKVILSAIDCTGHGVPGAFMVVMANSLLNEIIIENKITDPAEILTRLDAKVISALHQNTKQQDNSNDGMDLGLICIDILRHQLVFSGARSSLYQVRDNQINEFKGSKFPVGSVQYKEKIFQTIEIPIQSGDMYYLSTDGFQDQFGGEENRKYMKRNFRDYLLSISHLDMDSQKKHLHKEFKHWKGSHEQTDDVLVIGVKF